MVLVELAQVWSAIRPLELAVYLKAFEEFADENSPIFPILFTLPMLLIVSPWPLIPHALEMLVCAMTVSLGILPVTYIIVEILMDKNPMTLKWIVFVVSIKVCELLIVVV